MIIASDPSRIGPYQGRHLASRTRLKPSCFGILFSLANGSYPKVKDRRIFLGQTLLLDRFYQALLPTSLVSSFIVRCSNHSTFLLVYHSLFMVY